MLLCCEQIPHFILKYIHTQFWYTYWIMQNGCAYQTNYHTRDGVKSFEIVDICCQRFSIDTQFDYQLRQPKLVRNIINFRFSLMNSILCKNGHLIDWIFSSFFSRKLSIAFQRFVLYKSVLDVCVDPHGKKSGFLNARKSCPKSVHPFVSFFLVASFTHSVFFSLSVSNSYIYTVCITHIAQ